MIRVDALRSCLATLTGDAVKLGVHLCDLAGVESIKADKSWRTTVAKKIGMTPTGVHKALKELAKDGIVTLARGVYLGRSSDAMSHPPVILARASSRESLATLDASDQTDETQDGSETPPWDRDAERSEGERAGRRVREGVASSTEGRDLNEHVPDAPPSPHRVVVDAIHRMYREAYDADATWGPKQGSIVARLLKAHAPDEVVRRARIMFFERRRWPAPPYDVGTLSVHFDKFAVSRGAGGMVGDARKTGAGYYGEVDGE